MEYRVSFTLVLTVLTLALSLVPAVVIWVVLMDLRTSSVDLLQGTTNTSMLLMARGIQELMIMQALANIDSLLSEGSKEMQVMVNMVQVSRILNDELIPSRFADLQGSMTIFQNQAFNVILGHPSISQLSITAYTVNSTDNVATKTFGFYWVAYGYNVPAQAISNRTLYLGTLLMDPRERWTTYNFSYVDQLLATESVLLSSQNSAVSFGAGALPTFNGYTANFNGVPLLMLSYSLPAQNNTVLGLTFYILLWTISDALKELLDAYPNDRLVLFNRDVNGYMMGVSHGKYYSTSDVDLRYANPFARNATKAVPWNCTRNNDAFIQQACQQLYAQYRGWQLIPVVQETMVLSGREYWVSTAISTTAAPATFTLIMLKDRATVMGTIDASIAEVDESVSSKKGVTFVVLGVVSAVAVVVSLSVGAWLATRLHTLARGMDRIAKLQFTDSLPPSTMFQELHRFQASFVQMKRGLQAFGKFVPQGVVKVLIGGQMKASDEMLLETLTVMFADIEGFSTICEKETPATIVTVCTEYFEALCSSIVQRNGTIDKFIGDCIMAMWNAPERLPGHERDAVAAALAMQSGVLELHKGWRQRGLPVLRFRLGVHTSPCLVGTFGCSYRVNYTCLGDGVNLASRLESLNKKFGTYLCVSQATYRGCCDDFYFRKLAKVTVPGKTEVLPVYEVLCEVDSTHCSSVCSPEDADHPGVVNLSVEEVDDEEVSDSSSGPSELPAPPIAKSISALSKGDSLVLGAEDSSSVDLVVYHWTYVDRAALLRHARLYEQVYEAAVFGDRAQARRWLAEKPLLGVPDPAWSVLAHQLEYALTGKPWDGVFYFLEK